MPYFHHFLSESLVNNKCYSSVAANQQRPNNNGMIKQVKSGYLLHYKKRLFGKAWREVFVVLYEDSSVIWFRERDRADPEGGVFLRDAPEMLAAGQWVSRIPVKPEMPAGCNIQMSIAMGSRHRDKVQWFLCKSSTELIEWMSAINKTLPPPPPPPEELRESRRNLATALAQQQQQQLSKAAIKDADCNDLAQKMSKVSIQQQQQLQLKQQQHVSRVSAGFSDRARSYSAGRLSAANGGIQQVTDAAQLYAQYHQHQQQQQQRLPTPLTRQMSFQDRSSGNYLSAAAPSDVAAGVLAAGALTQWNAGGDCWDWGMGWGWTGWNAAFCGTCAMEQAALAGHVPSIAAHHQATAAQNHHSAAAAAYETSAGHDHPSSAQFYFDGDDHDLGELGETADVGCDFGDFGGF